MMSQEEIVDVKMEVDLPENAIHRHQQPVDPLHPEEDAMDHHHLTEDALAHHEQPVDPLHPKEDAMVHHHQTEDTLPHHEQPVDRLHPEEDAMDHHHPTEDTLPHHEQPVDPLHPEEDAMDHHHQTEDTLAHHEQPVDPLHPEEDAMDHHHQTEITLAHHEQPVDPFNPEEDAMDHHHQTEDALAHHEQPVNPLQPEENVMDHRHQTEDALAHHEQPVDPFHRDEDAMHPHHQTEDARDHHHQLGDALAHHHQQVEPLDHRPLEDVLNHQVKNEPEIFDDQPVALDEHQLADSLGHRRQLENVLEVKDEFDIFDNVFDELEESLSENYIDQDKMQPAGSIDQDLQDDSIVHHSQPGISLDYKRQFKEEHDKFGDQQEGSLDHDFVTEDPPPDQQEEPVHQQRSESPAVLPTCNAQGEEEYFNYLQFEKDIEYYTQVKKQILVKKTRNVQSKICIANNVLKGCRIEPKEIDQILNSSISKLQYYTNQSLQYLNMLIKYDKSDRSLKQAILDTKPLPNNVLSIIYSDVRDIFIKYYVEKNQLPTMIDFLKSFHEKRDDVFYKNVKLSTLVKNNLVKYHHIPKLNRYILTENPELAYKRNLYLRQIINYRSMGKQIIHVTITKTSIDNRKMLLAVAASTAGLIDKCYSNRFAKDSRIGNTLIKTWLQSELIPKLASTSVIVLTQPRKSETVPNEYSIKEDMINWLQKRGIPFNTDIHSAQLYNLIKVFKKKYKEPGLYDEIFASSGFNVLICPIEYQSLDFFKTINLIGGYGGYLVTTLKKLSQDEWNQMEHMIVEQEKQMMREDDEMGRVVDNMFCLVKSGVVTEDFPDGCRGTKADNFAVHIGDIIVD